MGLNKDRGLQAMCTHRTLQVMGIAVITVSALCAFASVVYAQQRGEDIWGKGNDFSNAQGGVSAQPTLPVAGKVPKTAAWKAVCNEHFRNLDSDNRRERERIERRFSSAGERDRAWKDYVQRRDRQSSACADTWPGEFDLARARNDVETARGPTGGDAATCRTHAIPVPTPCQHYVLSLHVFKRGDGPYQSRFDIEGNLHTPLDEAAIVTLLDHSSITVSRGSSMEVLPVCLAMSREAQAQGLRPGTAEWRAWAEVKARNWLSSRGGSKPSPYFKSCGTGVRG